MFLDKLYKYASTGALQEWSIEVEENRYRTHSGQTDGAITVTEWTTCSGKNGGKLNETSPSEQALKDAQSKWQKKFDREQYRLSPEEAKSADGKFLEPMLAHKYLDHKKSLDFKKGVYLNTKYNGQRAVGQPNGIFSRKGKKINTLAHIENVIAKVFDKYPSIKLDGEIYNYELRQNLGKLISAISKKAPTSEELETAVQYGQYWIYDICDGVIIRTDSTYAFKRSKGLLKYKSFIESEFKIVDVLEGEGNLAGKVGKFELVADNGELFRAAPIGTHDVWEQWWNDRENIINKGYMGTVKYKELTPVTERGGGVPNHSKLVAIRDYYE